MADPIPKFEQKPTEFEDAKKRPLNRGCRDEKANPNLGDCECPKGTCWFDHIKAARTAKEQPLHFGEWLATLKANEDE